MADPTHSIRAEQLDIEVATEALAIALQPRLGELNRQRLLPVIERVLGEVDVPGLHVRIDRLAIDLGALPLVGLEDSVETALYDALHRSLRAAIEDHEFARRTAPPGASPEDGLVDLLAQYLQWGTLPFWAASLGVPPGDFSAKGLVQRLAGSAPASLAATIRRIGRAPNVLQRLVLSLDEAALQIVLRLLEPAAAALILAYMLDLRHIHRAEPILRIGDAEFERLLWILTLSYLVRDAGSQFNRKSFVAAILRGMAEDEGLDFGILVATLERGLRMTLRHLPLASSLPAVIGEIVRDLDIAPGETAPKDSDALPPLSDDSDDPAALAALIRRHAGDRGLLQRLVSRLDETALREILLLLEPVHAVLIVAYLVELRQQHRVEPLLSLGETDFSRHLWVLTLSYLTRDAGLQFNRRSFVRSLLEGLARSESLEYTALVATLARALHRTAAQRPVAASLPAVIDEIVDEIGGAFNPEDATEGPRGGDAGETGAPALAELIRHHAGDTLMLDRLVSRQDEATLQAALGELEPRRAALVINYLGELRRLHRQAPLLAQGDAAFARLLWVLALSYLAANPGVRFNGTGLVRALLEGMAESEDLAYGTSLAALNERLHRTAGRQPAALSLQAEVETLARESSALEFAIEEGPAALVERYVRLDALGYYLRHGVLPVGVLLHRRDLNAASLLADVSGLALVQLRTLLAGLTPDARWAAIRRIAGALPAEALAALARRLLPPSIGPESPLPAALVDAAAASLQPATVYACIIAALVDGDELDLDAIVLASEQTPPAAELPPDPAAWPAPNLAAALLMGLRGETPPTDAPAWAVLLELLLTGHAAEAKSFLHAVAGSSERDTLAARIPRRLLAQVLALLQPAVAPALEFLRTAIGKLAMAQRPGFASMLHRAVLSEALRSGSGAETAHALIARIMRAVFGGGPPPSVARQLIEAAQRVVLPQAARAALIGVLSASGDDTGSDAGPPPTALREQLLAWLAGTPSGGVEAPPLQTLLDDLPGIILTFRDDDRALLLQHAGKAELRQKWAVGLPESALARLVHAVEPARFRSLADSAELMHGAAVEVARSRDFPPPPRAIMWQTLFAYLAATPAAERSSAGFVAAILAHAAETAEPLRQTAARLARAAGRQSLVTALARDRPKPAPPEATPVRQARGARKPWRPRGKTAFGLDEPETPAGEPIYIGNAGLVLAGVFLPHLFRRLDLLAANESGGSEMRDHDAASRAVHLLQYLVDGNCSAPEPLLVLNKILCGLPSDAPILREILPAERELALCDDLLAAMISRWDIIQSSSVAALRETFLKRAGKLIRKDDAWHLRVERKTVDVLVDRVPWNIALIFHAWMRQPLHVTW